MKSMTSKPAAKKNLKTEDGTRMPVLFLGHGSPMNAIEDSVFSRGWSEAAKALPKPKAVLCVSAHWETEGALVTAMGDPRTIHDFGGFPRELYRVRYEAPGSPALAEEIRDIVRNTRIGLDVEWGLDHGCWSVLRRMYPRADVPVVQLSLDFMSEPRAHYDLARELAPLRRRDVLIVGSGNIVHNLGRVVLRGDDFNEPFGLDWALKASAKIKTLIQENRHEELIAYEKLGGDVALAVPTPEHYLPLLYILALKEEDERVEFFNDEAVAGSLTMTSLLIGG
jgi:4,5-DOPA dioxygenase extradiol